jgi:hypothetical protein
MQEIHDPLEKLTAAGKVHCLAVSSRVEGLRLQPAEAACLSVRIPVSDEGDVGMGVA